MEKIIQNHLNSFLEITALKVLKTDFFTAIKSNLDSAYYNAVSFLKNSISAEDFSACLKEIKDFYQQYHTPNFCIWDYNYNSVSSFANENSFAANLEFIGLSCQLQDENYELKDTPDVYYKKLKSIEELKDFFLPFHVSFPFTDTAFEEIKKIYHNNFNNVNLTHYVAYQNESPIACASLYILDGIAGLYNLAVLPDYRNRGIGKNLQKIRLNDAKKLGIKSAVIQAASITERMSKQLNFQPCTIITPLVYEGETR